MPHARTFVRPAEDGLQVWNHETRQPLPPTGAWVPLDHYWSRLLLIDRAVVVAEPPAAEEERES